MFTIKFYSDGRSRILSAESFTILRGGGGGAEITLHQKNQLEDSRVDIGPPEERDYHCPPIFQRAIIENAAGKTTEIIESAPPAPSQI